MNYHSLNWDAEAKRVAWAFDLVGEYHFEELELELEMNTVPNFCHRNGDLSIALPYVQGGKFVCQYSSQSRSYWIQLPVPASNRRTSFTTIAINAHFGPTAMLDNPHHAHLLARGLARLGYLTPEIEAELEVSITAHERLEWALEYAARNEL